MKTCITCKINKDDKDFYKRKDAKDGLRNQCKFCFGRVSRRNSLNNNSISQYLKQYKKNNDAKIKKYRTNEKQNYINKRQLASDLLGGMCFMCETKENLHFHHIWYDMHSENSRKPYRLYIVNEVIHHPEKFMLLCRSCHRTIHNLQISYGIEQLRCPSMEL